MSTTIRRALAALFALGLTVALAACGDDDDSSGDDSASETTEESDDSTDSTEEGSDTTEPDDSTETTEAATGENPDSEFCQDLQGFSEEAQGLAGASSSDFASAYGELADSMGDLDVPDEISDDWDQMSDAIDSVADAAEGASEEDIDQRRRVRGLGGGAGRLRSGLPAGQRVHPIGVRLEHLREPRRRRAHRLTGSSPRPSALYYGAGQGSRLAR